MRLQSAIFDMDGTLIDSMSMWRNIGPTILRQEGITLTEEMAATFSRITDKEAVQYLRTHCGLDWTQEQVFARIHEIMADFYANRV